MKPKNFRFEVDQLVHAFHAESSNYTMLQMKCFMIGIDEEFEETTEAVTCLECIAEEP